MIAHQAEAIVLRTWPLHEADQIVSLFTRDLGKIRGVARSAAKSRRRFGGALEPTTFVRARYVEKPKQELVRLDLFEVLHSPLAEPIDYARACALAFFVEVLEETLPDHDPQDGVFRLARAVLDETRVGRIWMPITYFALWITRLMGWLPDLGHCLACGARLAGSPSYFHAHADGLFCARHGRRPDAGSLGQLSVLAADSQALALSMLRMPVSALAAEPWPRQRGADLRRFLIGSLERHLERGLTTVAALSHLPLDSLVARPEPVTQSL